MGSNKAALVRQFLTESGLITFGAMLLGIILVLIVLPYFNTLANKSIEFPFSNPLFWGILLLSVVVLGLFSGSYPAFFMSKFAPVKVLKGSGGNSVGGSKIRSVLVVVQFAVSVFLIIGTLVVAQQLSFIQNKDLGYSKDQVLLIGNVGRLGNDALSFKEDVKNLAQVSNASLSGFLPTPSFRSDSSFFLEGKMEQESAINMQGWRVDFDYINTLDLQMVAGRDFDPSITTDSTAIIVNESAIKVMQLSPEQALGKRIFNGIGEGSTNHFTIVGIVRNFHFESMRNEIRPLSLMIDTSNDRMAVKLSAGNFESAIAQIQQIWDSRATGIALDYRFMDDSFNEVYQNEQRLGKIFFIFTALSIFIACLGLFGLAAFNAQKRIKEIGVRKVLGASVSQITYRLSYDFLKLVVIAILVALPLGWLAMNRWLQDFTYRIDIGLGVFLMASLLAIVIALATVSYQSIKAAIVNPVKSLRTE